MTNEAACVKNSWYIDSGATSHMASDREFFTLSYKEIKDKVTVADGKEVIVLGIGSGVITSQENKRTITLKNVLHIPKLSGNLISVKRITESGFKVQFKGKECNILRNQDVIVRAICNGNLYKLDTIERAIFTVSKHKDTCIHTLHNKLGHRCIDAIRRLVNDGMAEGISIQKCGNQETCETCIKGKISRKPFPKESTRQTKSVLEIVHTDVCGPMETVTPGGKRYFLTMIDNYSGYTEIFLMSNKSEVSKHIRTYVETVKNKFNKKPKTLRSDRGREYVNHEVIT